MENKDLFDAIHNVDENYIANAWQDTEIDRPIVLRPEARSPKRALRSIMLGVGGTAAAAALGFAVFAGTNGLSLKPKTIPENPASSASLEKEFDPNSPLPIEIVAPDGKLLTYNDLVGASISQNYLLWQTKSTAEEIAQMSDLFENFFDIIKDGDGDGWGGFSTREFVYLPEPGSDTLKRYNTGDIYCGLKIDFCDASFDENCKYYNGFVHFESTLEISDVEVTRTGDSDYQINNPDTSVPDHTHFGGIDYYVFTSSDPKLTALTGGLNNEFIEGKIGLYTDLPLNTPAKATIRNIGLCYCADESCYCESEVPTITFSAHLSDFGPLNESLEQWLEKDLAAPYASAPDDFSFLCDRYIDINLGDEIFAVDDGEVIAKTSDSVVIKHGENLYTTYYPIDVSVDIGDNVKAGDVIGIANYEYDSGCEFAYKFTLNQPDLTDPNGMY